MRQRPLSRAGTVLTAAAMMSFGAPGLASAQSAAGVIVRGVVRDAAQQPLADAEVSVELLPAMDAVGVGDVYMPNVIAETKTRADGTFSVPLTGTYPDAASAAAVNDGIANFWLSVKKVQAATPKAIETPPNGVVYSAADMFYLAVDETGALGEVTGQAGEVYGLADLVVLEAMASGLLGATTSAGMSDQECSAWGYGQTIVEASQVNWEPFGQVHTGWDTSMEIQYGEHANTDLSGAIKPSGGNWKATAGYAHMGNKASIIKTTYHEYRGLSVLTKFGYVKERWEWKNNANAAPCYVEHRIRATGWKQHSIADGMDRYNESTWSGVIEADQKGFLGEFRPNSSWTKKSGRGRKMTLEVQAFGVGLAAQSTWSAQIDVFYDFGSGDKRLHYLYHPKRELSDAPAVYAW